MPRSLFLTGIGVKIDRDGDFVGCGGFGLVFKCELQGELVALKVLYKTNNNIVSWSRRHDLFRRFRFKQEFYREALMWRSLRHEFVLPFLGIYEDDLASHFFLVSPYMSNGTLAQWRKRVNPSTSEIEDWVRFLPFQPFLDAYLGKMREVAQGIQYIHSEGVVHGDLRGVFDLK